jgi:hypothetical protein
MLEDRMLWAAQRSPAGRRYGSASSMSHQGIKHLGDSRELIGEPSDGGCLNLRAVFTQKERCPEFVCT